VSAPSPIVPRETNPLVVALAEVAIAVVARRREVAAAREKITVVDGRKGGRAA
jgi:hypothetical protein